MSQATRAHRGHRPASCRQPRPGRSGSAGGLTRIARVPARPRASCVGSGRLSGTIIAFPDIQRGRGTGRSPCGRCPTVPGGTDPVTARPSAPRRFAASDQVNNPHERPAPLADSIGTVLVVTTDQLPGYEIRQILGEVVSSMARTRNPYREGVKNLRGGAYDPMAPDNLTRWRTDSVARLGEEARAARRERGDRHALRQPGLRRDVDGDLRVRHGGDRRTQDAGRHAAGPAAGRRGDRPRAGDRIEPPAASPNRRAPPTSPPPPRPPPRPDHRAPVTRSATTRRCAGRSGGSEDRGRGVGGGLRVGFDDRGDPVGDRASTWAGGGADEGVAVGDQGVDLGAGQAEPAVGGQPVEEVVLRRRPSPAWPAPRRPRAP